LVSVNQMVPRIVGRYLKLKIESQEYRIYYEEAGKGTPLLCLHTAAADTRQFHDMMEDAEVTKSFRVIAFDLPSHGKSSPVNDWMITPYVLTGRFYLQAIIEFCRALGLERPVILGCSMGGSIVLELVAGYPRLFGGIIGLEATDRSSGKVIEFLDHPHVNSVEFIPHYISGLISPMAPHRNREMIMWSYSQSGKGVMAGDMEYYYKMDIRDKTPKIDTRLCPVYLLTGEHDYSCTPKMTRQTALRIPGAKFRVMKGLGHFPMAENYSVFRRYLLPVLSELERERKRRFQVNQVRMRV
jgi:pimeloyl-ACP methyl ester carboxylesterase